MTDMEFQRECRQILSEITGMIAQVKEAELVALEEAIATAGATFVTGAGRSGLIGRCLAVRLAQLGLTSHVLGDSVTSAIRRGDLLVAVSRSGETPTTCLHARLAAGLGARVAAITAVPTSTLANTAQIKAVVGATSKNRVSTSVQYGGSLFEQSLLVLLDAVALRLQQRLGQTADQMDSRHANLE